MDENEKLTPFEPHQEKILVDILEGWWPKLPLLAEPVSASWGDRVFDSDEIEMHATGDMLRVGLRTPEPSEMFSPGLLRIQLRDGTSIIADAAAHRRVPSPLNESKTYFTHHFEMSHWEWHKAPAFAWVLDAPGFDYFHAVGNLTARIYYDDGSMKGLLNNICFDAATRTCMVRSSNGARANAWVVFSSHIARWLTYDRMFLAFALGQRIGTANMIAIDERGETVGVRYHPLRAGTAGSQRPTVPFFDSNVWAADLFERVAATVRNDHRLRSAINIYVDSLDDSFTGSFLKIASALSILVAPDQAAEATSPLDLDAAPLAQQIERAFSEVGLHAPEFLAVLESVDPLRDALRIFDADVFRGLRIVETCRTAFIALVARRVRYAGPIEHWSLQGKAETIGIPAWWPRPANPEPKKRFHIDAHRPASASGRFLWPEFKLPQPSDHPLIKAVEEFAFELQSHTRNLVSARLWPHVGQAPQGTAFDFKLVVRRRPELQSVLFTVREFSEGIIVEGWDADPSNILSASELKTFLSDVASATKTSTTIQRLMLMATSFGD